MPGGGEARMYSWGERSDTVRVTLFVSLKAGDKAGAQFRPDGRVSCSGTDSTGRRYALELQLRHPILAEDCRTKVLGQSIQLYIAKQKAGRWGKLQRDGLQKSAAEKKDFDYMDFSDSSDSDNDSGPVFASGDGASLGRIAAAKARKTEKNVAQAERNRGFVASITGLDWTVLILLLSRCGLPCLVCEKKLTVRSAIYCPYTKVEESFNTQAVHDFLFLRTDFSSYDHHVFPGSVPRTCLGALLQALVAAPLAIPAFLSNSTGSKVVSLIIVRCILGAASWLAMTYLKRNVSLKFGRNAGIAFVIIECCQFHSWFYASRSLPNTYALIITNIAVAFWLMERYHLTFALLAVAAAIFRAEVALLLASIFLVALVRRRIEFWPSCKIIVSAGFAAAVVSTIVDSIFWGYLVWPELTGFLYNVVGKQSSNWGISPWHWYFTSALPRGLLLTCFFIPLAVYQDWQLKKAGSGGRILPFLYPCLMFVALYSFLPHKELRFIIYIVPVLNIASALALTRLFDNRCKSKLAKWVFQVACGLLTTSFLMSIAFGWLSFNNYPGGEAMDALHRIDGYAVQSGQVDPILVHIDNAAAQMGVSRFTELPLPWRYSKEENVQDFSPFSHLVTEHERVEGFRRIGAVRGVMGIRNPGGMLGDKMFVHKKKPELVQRGGGMEDYDDYEAQE